MVRADPLQRIRLLQEGAIDKTNRQCLSLQPVCNKLKLTHVHVLNEGTLLFRDE